MNESNKASTHYRVLALLPLILLGFPMMQSLRGSNYIK